MIIGLIGADLASSNKGCEALAYSFLEILNRVAQKRDMLLQVFLVKSLPTKKWIKSGCSYRKISCDYTTKRDYSNISLNVVFCFHTLNKIFFPKELKEADFVIDFTGGDSFSDIYGKKRFYSRTYLKSSVIKHGIPLVLGSQTIGPFLDKEVESIAAKVIKECIEVFARDEVSYEYAMKISGRQPILTTDVAFSLPYKKVDLLKSDKIKIGLNVSGLLWNGGYTKNNQFGLICEYQSYCRKLISILLSKGLYEIHLIPHAFKEDLSDLDNDLIPVNILHDEFPDTIVSPKYDYCGDVKGYIAAMDVFTGARMHSTIGAFSAGVPVIPFSYSRKFEGLFQSLKYPYVLKARELDTDDCVKQTVQWIQDYSLLKEAMSSGKEIVLNRTERFTKRLDEILVTYKK